MNSIAHRRNGEIQQLPYRVQLLSKALQRLPTTAEGIPIGYYRVDLLPEAPLNNPQEEIQALKNAYTDLSFDYGFPTFSDGRPFWYKLDYEPGFAFGCLEIYLEDTDEGPRDISRLAGNLEIRRIAKEILHYNPDTKDTKDTDKDTDTNADTGTDVGAGTGTGTNGTSLPPEFLVQGMLREFSILYMWRARAKAYDIYKEASYRHLRIRRQSSLENEHYLLAADLLDKLKAKVMGQPRFFDDMSPKVATDLLSKLVAIQRVSVGLPASGPLSQKEQPEDINFEMILRSIGEKAKGNVFDQQGNPAGNNDVLGLVLQDPRAAGMMQEMIIRVSRKAHEREDRPHNRFLGRDKSSKGNSNGVLVYNMNLATCILH